MLYHYGIERDMVTNFKIVQDPNNNPLKIPDDFRVEMLTDRLFTRGLTPGEGLALQIGTSLSFDDIKENLGKQASKYLVHFWASWCDPCEKEMPEFLEMALHLANREHDPIKTILVAVNSPYHKIRKFLSFLRVQDGKESYIFVNDGDGRQAEKFGTYRLPETYLVDHEGVIVRKFIGAQNWKSLLIKNILATKPSQLEQGVSVKHN
jgi:thiol-disulfide isomerase/thioredoxin